MLELYLHFTAVALVLYDAAPTIWSVPSRFEQ